LAHNVLRCGVDGQRQVAKVSHDSRPGLSMTFIDQGPGIADVSLALTARYTTGGGMGLGLSGAKRLSDSFELQTQLGDGTTVKIMKWKPY
jgi:serine/threonine-protein kinase RsbT